MGTGRDESLCLVWAAGRATAAVVRANAASECVAALATAVKPTGSPPSSPYAFSGEEQQWGLQPELPGLLSGTVTCHPSQEGLCAAQFFFANHLPNLTAWEWPLTSDGYCQPAEVLQASPRHSLPVQMRTAERLQAWWPVGTDRPWGNFPGTVD